MKLVTAWFRIPFWQRVLGGFVLGAAWLALTTAAFEIWREERGLRRTAPLEEGVGAV